jgi:hypothetical protein
VHLASVDIPSEIVCLQHRLTLLLLQLSTFALAGEILTSHPHSPLILLSNRDEYLNRPTARADFWPAPNDDVLGPRDLAREQHGSWIGITRTGRLAVLLNYRETKPDGNVTHDYYIL